MASLLNVPVSPTPVPAAPTASVSGPDAALQDAMRQSRNRYNTNLFGMTGVPQ
jgi:hypothetical protein